MSEIFNPNRRPTRREFLESAIKGLGAGGTEITIGLFTRKRLNVPKKIADGLYGTGIATIYHGISGHEDPTKNGFQTGALGMAIYQSLQSINES